nr:MAG TPA: hypothetical protein [Caudoviricetes sp.]
MFLSLDSISLSLYDSFIMVFIVKLKLYTIYVTIKNIHMKGEMI